MSVGLNDVAVLAWEGASTVCDQANATMKAIAIAPIEKTSFRILSSFGCKIDAEILHVSCFKSVPSQAENGVVTGFVGFVESRAKKTVFTNSRGECDLMPATNRNWERDDHACRGQH